MLRARLGAVHRTSADRAGREQTGVVVHRFPLEAVEVVRLHDLLVTGLARTVVDVAGAAPFEEGVMVADAALLAGVPRAVLEAVADLADRAGRARASRT